MRYGSICSGIEAASAAWGPLGWEPAWFSEIEDFPSAVLKARHPEVPNLGDMTKLRENITSDQRKIDVLVGGTPCQAFSVAGLRGSLSDERGNLTLEFVRIADDLDPAFTVWENVPGVLSTRDNAFGCFLGALAGEGEAIEPGPRPEPGRSSKHWGWSEKAGSHVARWPKCGWVDGPRRTIAWRVLDAQYFGVAQRRRRVFVVACPRGGADPREILFESEGVRRDTAPSREAGQSIARDVAPSLRGGGCGAERVGDSRGQDCVVATTTAALTSRPFADNESQETKLVVQQPYKVANCLTQRMHKGINSTLDEGQTPVLVCATGPITRALTQRHDSSEDGTGRGVPTIAFNAREDLCVTGDTAGSLGCGHPQAQAIAFNLRGRDGGSQAEVDPDGLANLRASSGGSSRTYVVPAMQVRRLTEVECERLQGFLDGHTDILYGRPKYPDQQCPSGHRYKALGNSMAVPVMRWIGERITAIAQL